MIEDYRYNAVIPENTGWNAYNNAIVVILCNS